MAYEYVPLIEIPTSIDRSLGDIHPDGNPHVHLNPRNLILVGKELANRLASIDEVNAVFYESRYGQFEAKMNQAIEGWLRDGKELKSMQVITKHKSLSYLIDFFGLKEVASLEPRPGLPPTSSHLARVLESVSSMNARAIVRAPYESDRGVDWIVSKANIKNLVVPYTVNGDDESGDLFSLFDRSLAILKSAL
jgi:zinc/manganese transport system substrate-binding protein